MVEPALTQAMGQVATLRGWTLVPLAQFQRGARYVVVVWPALDASQRLAQDNVVAGTFTRTAAGFTQSGGTWVVRDPTSGRAQLERALGGRDYQVRTRGEGVPLANLGPRVCQLTASFISAVRSRSPAQVRQAVIAYSRLYSIERVAYSNAMIRTLWLAATHGVTLTHQGTDRVPPGGRIRLQATRAGGAIPRTLTARQVTGAGDRFVVSEER